MSPPIDAAIADDAPPSDDVQMGGLDAAYRAPPFDAGTEDAGGSAPADGSPSM